MIVGRLRSFLLRFTALRRVVTILILLFFTALTVALSPILGVLASVASARPGGRWRVWRLGAFLAVYLGAECIGLVWAALLWARSVVDRRMSAVAYQEANYALLARMLSWLYTAGVKLFGLSILPPQALGAPRSPDPTAPDLPTGPLLVLSRHGGPGDSFLLVYALLEHGHRTPRIVLKDTLAFNPLIDVALGRVPHCFVRPNPDDGETVAAGIGRLAATMRPQDTLIVFPEGGNFTARRRTRAIARLRRRGLRESANRAQRLRHVLPPRPAGVFAAIDAAPGADVIFVAHTGLDHMQSFSDVWNAIPLSDPVEVTWWTVPAAQIPAEKQDRLRWLEDNWAKVDGWIDRHQPVAPAEAAGGTGLPVSPGQPMLQQPVLQVADGDLGIQNYSAPDYSAQGTDYSAQAYGSQPPVNPKN
jgi:1-acyl-sn-glycerol-3-phosphate acyltransferase